MSPATMRPYTMRTSSLVTLLGGLILSATVLTAHGQTTAPLYDALGQKDGIRRLSEDFVQRLSTDTRTAAFFKDSKLKRVQEKIAEQLCLVSGGGCVYTGDSMVEVHKGLGIQMANFNALVEILQDAMTQQGIPFREQNKLLAKLAPMYRDMVEAPKGTSQ